MKLLKFGLLAALAWVFASASFAATVELNGVKLEDATEVRGSKLLLNGIW